MDEQRPPQARADRGSVLIAASVIGAALILSWGLSSGAPRYQLAASGETVVRMDTDSGELIACNQQRCARVEPPDRAKMLGPFKFQFGTPAKKPALPAPGNEAQR
ncbi:MAG: hypothetical protein ACJ8FL_08185 [Sphingomicrobium sp.]